VKVRPEAGPLQGSRLLLKCITVFVLAAKTNSNSSDFRRNLIDFNAKMLSRWRKQVVDEALTVITTSRESSGQQRENIIIQVCCYYL
jgi:hypothetical protein